MGKVAGTTKTEREYGHFHIDHSAVGGGGGGGQKKKFK